MSCWSRFPARDAASARPAPRVECTTRRRTSCMGCCHACRCGSGSCHCRGGRGGCWRATRGWQAGRWKWRCERSSRACAGGRGARECATRARARSRSCSGSAGRSTSTSTSTAWCPTESLRARRPRCASCRSKRRPMRRWKPFSGASWSACCDCYVRGPRGWIWSHPARWANAQAEALLLLSAAPQEPSRRKQHSAFLEGFSLHAGVHLHANDREALQRLCAYGARPPLSLERLAALPDGRLAYRLKRPLRDGRQVLVLQPTEFLRRLATLVPPRRHHLVRYHGVFAPNASWREAIVPRPTEAEARCAGAVSEGPVLPARGPRVEGSGPSAPPFPTALG